MFRLSLLLALFACNDTETPVPFNEQEVITRVDLVFSTPSGSSEFRWSDPENDGTPIIDEVQLEVGIEYSLRVGFHNELATPPEDVTTEIDTESDQHQIFFTVDPAGLANQTYNDTDVNGLPVGLENIFAALEAGSGTLTVMLRHLPPLDGVPVKVAGLAEEQDTSTLPGDTDALVSFPLQVR